MESFTTYSFAISGLLIAQWESALGVDGKQFAQIVKLVGNYFTIYLEKPSFVNISLKT